MSDDAIDPDESDVLCNECGKPLWYCDCEDYNERETARLAGDGEVKP
ncbi:MAG TPA: hypothetical protein VGL45_09870 [Bradyrhizobium sp.]